MTISTATKTLILLGAACLSIFLTTVYPSPSGAASLCAPLFEVAQPWVFESIVDPTSWTSHEYLVFTGPERVFSVYDENAVQAASLLSDPRNQALQGVATKIWRLSFNPKFVHRDRTYERELKAEFALGASPKRTLEHAYEIGEELEQRRTLREIVVAPSVEIAAIKVTFKNHSSKTFIFTGSRITHVGSLPEGEFHSLLENGLADVDSIDYLHTHPVKNMPMGTGDAASARWWRTTLNSINPHVRFSLHAVTQTADSKLAIFSHTPQ